MSRSGRAPGFTTLRFLLALLWLPVAAVAQPAPEAAAPAATAPETGALDATAPEAGAHGTEGFIRYRCLDPDDHSLRYRMEIREVWSAGEGGREILEVSQRWDWPDGRLSTYCNRILRTAGVLRAVSMSESLPVIAPKKNS